MRGKCILLGITGGIAAYKIAFLIRLLKKSGAEVKCIMTPASCDFISPLVVSTLSENPVGIEFWNKSDGTWNNHVDYGLWADLFVIAPLTANSLSKMVIGSCDNLLLASYLSMKAKTLVAPAMDLDMYAHPTTQRNLNQLRQDGALIIPAEEGELASGLTGEGRMAEPQTIFNAIQSYFSRKEHPALIGKNVLITAGPTYESIDPVRFIGNQSSGKMGFSLAKQFLAAGAKVHLITGPTKLDLHDVNLTLIRINSAKELNEEVMDIWKHMDIGVFSAAVSDYRPKVVSEQKIKKIDEEFTVEMVKNPDVLKWSGENKGDNQILIGFALETSNLVDNGKGKLEKKNLDFIVLNTLEDEGAGFSFDTNKITILDNRNNLVSFELKSKDEVAEDIVNYLINYIS